MNKGTSFIELLMALGVVSIALLALVSLVTKSISNTTFSKESTQASRYTQELLEWLRGERDTEWQVFSSRASAGVGRTYCLNNLSWSNTGACGNTEFIANTRLLRELTLTLIDPVTVEALVRTTWTDGSGSHNVRSTTTFTSWIEN